MPGSILGKDQENKLNAVYPRIHAHICALLSDVRSFTDRMRVHFLVDHIDTPELSAMFREVPFISPDERRALVRMAIYDAILGNKVDVVADPGTDLGGVKVTAGPETLKEFTPAPFKLNVAKVENHHV